jgi:cellulose synthase/poly-beta-1,6-N-acetylglucosamine synthase-like glycosyltransferase
MEAILIVGSILIIAYGYFLYPVLMRFSARYFGKPWVKSSSETPYMSIILAVYNEGLVLRQCLDALLSLDYQPDKLEILVGSDGSTDETKEILAEYAKESSRLHSYLFEQRRGKIPIVNDLVSHARGEVLFFTDADVTLDVLSLRMHARNYASDEVGGVAGNLILSGTEGKHLDPLKSEQYYMSVENRLRRNEALLHSTVGIFGGHYSIRRDLWRELPNEPICDELFIGLSVIGCGKRMIFERDAIAREHSVRTMSEEFRRKTRFAARGLLTLMYFKALLMPWAGWPAVMLWSHKMLRWLSSYCILLLLLIFPVEAFENTNVWTEGLLALEIGAIVVLLLSIFMKKAKAPVDFLAHASWFFAMNAAFAVGTFRFFLRREQKFWSPSTRVRQQGALPIDVVSHKRAIIEEAVHS